MRTTLTLFAVATVLTAAPLAGLADDVRWIDCTFGPLPDREIARLHVMAIGDRVERAVVEPFGLAGTDGSGLKVTATKLAGTLVIGHDRLRMNRRLIPRLATRMALELDLTLSDGKVTGR